VPEKRDSYWCRFASEGGFYSLDAYYPENNHWERFSNDYYHGTVMIVTDTPSAWTTLPLEEEL